MLSVYKYRIGFGTSDEFEIVMPKGAQFLHFDNQGGVATLWALIDTNPACLKVPYRFRIAGTGHPIRQSKEELQFIGTALFSAGALVFHLFYIKP